MDQRSKPLRVLTVGGGGMRGIYTATYLDRVANAFANRLGIGALDIGAAFDLIVGTSSGGIIACTLAAGNPLSDIIELYVEHGPKTFTRPLPRGVFSAIFDIRKRPKALAQGTKALRQALESRFGKFTLGKLYKARGIGLAIPATEMGQHRAWVFKTPHLKKTTNHRDDHYNLVDVCLATTAAPIYRSMAVIDHPDNNADGYNIFVDGGLWANNPVLVGLIDALEMAEPNQEIQIYCLGSCPFPAGDRIDKSSVHRGLLEWKFGGDAASLAIDAQQFAFDHMAKKLMQYMERKCSIIRFPSEQVPASLNPYLGLDDTRHKAIQALTDQARSDADMANSKCAHQDTDNEAAMICALFESMPEWIGPCNETISTTTTHGRSEIKETQ